MHLGTKKGEVANRILSVGSMDRAILIAGLLDPPEDGGPIFQNLSSRGFLTITGTYKGIPISIVTTMMGMPNMDFVVRECRAVVDGEMAIVRLGTCGGLRAPARLGTFVVAQQAVCVRRDPDAFTAMDGRPYYTTSLPVSADPQLVSLVAEAVREQTGGQAVVVGKNATTDSFYSSQGRLTPEFEDHNCELMAALAAADKALLSLEMETFHLLDLARCSRGTVRAAAFAIVLGERWNNSFISHDLMVQREQQGGVAALNALARVQLDQDVSLLNGRSGIAPPPGGYVWAPRTQSVTASAQ